MFDAGMVRPGSKVWIPVNTFDSNDPSASVTATTWANTDCHVHKDGGTTQRASSAGETLSINFDTVTGNHLLEIDTADNTTANFYEAGSTYHVRIEGVTVDAGNVNAWIGWFRIGYEAAILNTTIATLASQTSFTLEEGSAEASTYVGCPVIIHDLASAVQLAIGYISAYAVTTKTVTLAADPGIFTMAAGDSVSIFMPANVQAVAGTTQTAGDLAALVTTVDTVVDGIQNDLSNGTDGLGAIKLDTAAILTDTAEIGTAGAGLTNINLPNQTMDITGSITGNLSGSVGSVTGGLNTAAGTITTLDGLDTAQDTQHATTQGKVDTAQADLDILTGTDGVTLATSQANYAPATVAALATAQSDLDTLTGSDGATLATAQPNVGNIPGTAQTGTLSTTVMTTDLTGYADDELIGRVVIWTGGDADGQASDITDYASTNGTVTFTAITTAPANGDTFVIV